MKVWTRVVLLIMLLAAFVFPTTALAKELREDKVVFGGAYTLESGETLDGNLVVFGGVATLEVDSRVEGDVVVIGGTVQADGEITGSIVGVGGLVTVGDAARISGDILVMGAHLDLSEAARVEGSVSSGVAGPLSFSFPGGAQGPPVQVEFSPIVNFFWFWLRTFLWAALGVLLVLFLPRQVANTGRTVVSQPLVSGALGLLTALIAPVAMVIMVITILLIPGALLVAVVLAAAWAFGLVALGLELGKRLAVLLKQSWAPAVEAGVGTFILLAVVNGFGSVPCVGWIFPTLVGMVGIGAVILSRFGTQAYPPGPALVRTPPAPAPPAAPLAARSPQAESGLPAALLADLEEEDLADEYGASLDDDQPAAGDKPE